MKKTIFFTVCSLVLASQADVNIVLTAGQNDTLYPVVLSVITSSGEVTNGILDSLQKYNQTVTLKDDDSALVTFSYKNGPLFTLEADAFQNSLKLSLYDGSYTKIANSTTPLLSDVDYTLSIPIGVITQSVNKRAVVRPSDATIKAINKPIIMEKPHAIDTTGSLDDELDWIEKEFQMIDR